ncbi:protein-methionine-sulfoxide reductase catalytic subunit MsrP [Geitlerinema sp. PCC 7407]|uniref:protein-methionine-sulfoxide reductase catalytic subunit MsrP n=1 Tax=Geitlerinema sp. PCC 7407 TaxID=1173025 RepID=UPI00029FC66E|nr:protein-methionine-sulfoxide reductase catalytic subunit MsrP [Geitlerinema sp. PCC 7407]AFY65891.1 oxidoreductase molybdopterin binding protein [Geitlerinema sp. PCC 7407]
MVFIRVPKPWEMPDRAVTSEQFFWNRRRFLKSVIGAGVGLGALSLTGCSTQKDELTLENVRPGVQPLTGIARNPAFAQVDRPITTELLAATYNNFYEFGSSKNAVWRNARALPTESWKVEVSGLVKNPKTYDLDDLRTQFPIEERVYRFRCVEAWSMALPWIGFPMRSLIAAVEPTSQAKFVRFTSFYDKEVTPGPLLSFGSLPWPYTEGLRIEEMANELAFFAIGIYGHTLPKQHGAPVRMVLPWKYGFKGAKSIVKIEFVERQPATYWNTLVPNEYGFEANVNPQKPHPRWSQAEERFVGDSAEFEWEMRETLPYNGYGEYVASLYARA